MKTDSVRRPWTRGKTSTIRTILSVWIGLALSAGVVGVLEGEPDPAKLRIPTGGKLPRPGIGLYFKAEEVEALRAKARRPPCHAEYARLVQAADSAMARWPADKAVLRLEQWAPRLPDLVMEHVPAAYAPEGAKAAGAATMRGSIPNLTRRRTRRRSITGFRISFVRQPPVGRSKDG